MNSVKLSAMSVPAGGSSAGDHSNHSGRRDLGLEFDHLRTGIGYGPNDSNHEELRLGIRFDSGSIYLLSSLSGHERLLRNDERQEESRKGAFRAKT